ncbi:MAG: threonine--tRNA ligase [Bacillales bacterium]|nr:threonine--tRNA ligase [Bacillales bacterium]
MKITCLDGKSIEFNQGESGLDIAKKISLSLAKESVAYKLNGHIYDLNRPLCEEGEFVLIKQGEKDSYDVLNHSTSHLLAQAIQKLYPGAKFGFGPSIEEGFYYDIDFPTPITDADFAKIEKEMKKCAEGGYPIVRQEVSKEEALEIFKDNPYKVELINGIEGTISLYRQGDFVDLCAGPHLSKTSQIKHFKLLSLAGAYWRGDIHNKQLTRIYGTSWWSKDELDTHLNNLEERKKRDHRKLGKELNLFMLSEFGPGLPFWLPKGYTLRRTLEDFWLRIHRERGYEVINTPIMLNRQLWETSGHWDHYKDDMFVVNVEDGTYAIKPMNCPGAILVYNNSLHSYRELPLRYAELGNVHRYEASGSLNGLFRVRGFTQDDAHILLMESQVGDEVSRIISLYDYVYSVFGLNYSIELSTRPESNFIGEISTWDHAEEALKQACLKTGHEFKINPGDGAFYGPKLDFKLKDSMNRIWQCGTVQLDMQLPGRFNCTYIAEDGSKKTPVMIHRACFGSLERFIGIIIENFAGQFPTWLAPVQVNILPVADVHLDYALKLKEEFIKYGLRVNIDNSSEKLGYRLRQSSIQKTPYTLVVGDKEVENNGVTYRVIGHQEQIYVSKEEFLKLINDEISSLSLRK